MGKLGCLDDDKTDSQVNSCRCTSSSSAQCFLAVRAI